MLHYFSSLATLFGYDICDGEAKQSPTKSQAEAPEPGIESNQCEYDE